jgi:signal transduction histidine kinase
MGDVRKLVSTPDEAKGRLIAIFVGAVLLPSLALSYVAMHFVHQLASARKATEIKYATGTLYYIEKELAQTAQSKALDAARMLEPEVLLEGRPAAIDAALRRQGVGAGIFETLRLETSSPRMILRTLRMGNRREIEVSPEVLAAIGSFADGAGEDSVPWPAREGQTGGVLRFKFNCGYAHHKLIRDYFENEFKRQKADQSLVVRVTEPDGEVLYETAPTRSDVNFEVTREMDNASFRGLKLALRYRDLSIEQGVRRWQLWTWILIGFIDIMLGAGLLLVYSNVRRELHLSRLKSDFVANVSHELKTPLALIRLFAETLELGRVPTEDKARQYYRVINKESQRLTQLINNILDFSRIEAGRKEYHFAPTDIGRIVSEVVDSYRFQIEQQGFALEVQVADDLPEVDADKEALGQALLNLVNNAIKYSRDEKYLRLDVRRDGGRVLLSVTDRGIGVAKGEQKKIFEKFYRAENSLVHETKGSGLGLALVQHIMQAHGGTVEVESAPGKGSTFTLVLPIGSKLTRTAAIGDQQSARPGAVPDAER